MKKHIPNAITLCNLICGCIAVRYAFADKYLAALIFIVTGAVFDFFDGFVARKLKVSSPVGVELDSLADVITFGFAPTSMVFTLITSYIHGYAHEAGFLVSESWIKYINAISFIIAAFSALRLAKFNVDTRQTTSFIGLPTPANALLVASAVITLATHPHWLTTLSAGNVSPNLLGIIALATLSIVSAILLVCELPLFALKFKDFGWANNSTRYIFLISSALLLATMALQSLSRFIIAIGIVIVWYVILSTITHKQSK